MERSVLPFGLASAPRTYMKLLYPVAAEMQLKGIKIVIYLDDILVLASSKSQAVGGVGVHTQSEKVHLVTDTNLQILGAHGQFPSNDKSPSSEQDGENLRRSADMCLTNRK